jgi:hypothetical protein
MECAHVIRTFIFWKRGSIYMKNVYSFPFSLSFRLVMGGGANAGNGMPG